VEDQGIVLRDVQLKIPECCGEGVVVASTEKEGYPRRFVDVLNHVKSTAWFGVCVWILSIAIIDTIHDYKTKDVSNFYCSLARGTCVSGTDSVLFRLNYCHAVYSTLELFDLLCLRQTQINNQWN